GPAPPRFTGRRGSTAASYASGSIVALWVSIPASTSPRRTGSPGCLSQRASLPSCMVSLKRGMVISGIGAAPGAREVHGVERLVDGGEQVIRVRQRGQLERLGVRQRHLGRRHPP